MSKTTKKKTPAEAARIATEKVVKQGGDIRAEVRNITVDALSKHHLNLENIKSVIKAVLEGARNAAENNPVNMNSTLNDVTKGLDEALEKSAYASKLAIEEAAGNIKKFSEHDLKRAMDDISGLQEVLIESLTEVANSSKSVAAKSIRDIVTHFKNSGTEVGRRASEEIINLTKQFEKMGKVSMTSANKATRSIAMDIARVASGFLSGLADSINDTTSIKKTSKKKTTRIQK